MKKMIVRLSHDSQKPIDWLIIDEKGNSLSEFNQSIISDCEIYVLVPGSDVFLSHVKLPKLSRIQLIKAIPYALEDYLAEDIRNLHFAIVNMDSHDEMSVAVVSRKKMDEWKAQLAIFFKLQHVYFRMVPETLALPWKPEQWSVFIDKNMALVRTGPQSGFSVESTELWIVVHLFLNHRDTILPNTITIIGEMAIPVEEEIFFRQAAISLEWQSSTDFLTLISTNSDLSAAINLLQGPYKINRYFSKRKLLHHSAMALTFMCLFVLSVGLFVQFFILKNQAEQLHNQVALNFKHFFPGIQLVEDDAVQSYMQKTLQKIKKTQQESPFLKILTAISPLISEKKEITLLGFEYAGNKLTLAMEANDFSLLDNLSETLKKHSYHVILSDAKKLGIHVQAHLIIQEKK